jgi:hypothetical protein
MTMNGASFKAKMVLDLVDLTGADAAFAALRSCQEAQ